jgi:hypothetical protein
VSGPHICVGGQVPLKLHLTVQHTPLWQFAPLKQLAPPGPGPQLPPLQKPLQQSRFVLQVWNEHEHCVLQTPPRQQLPQQSASDEQAVPSLGSQVTQTVPFWQRPVQHWVLRVHANVVGMQLRQAVALQTLLQQLPEQQSVLNVQPAPTFAQQAPLVHWPLQHWLLQQSGAWTQPPPSGAQHGPEEHEPLQQWPEQHWPSMAQPWPSAPQHAPEEQEPLQQWAEQHWPSLVHA